MSNHTDINCSHNCREIDNGILIQEVKARPALYNRSSKEYNDQHFKKALWEEICAKIYHDFWDQLKEMEKDAKVAEVMKRWSNLRTCFSRELKIMRDPLQNKRRKYLYFDKLLFLLDEIRPDTSTARETEPTFIYSNSLVEEDDHEPNSTLKQSQEKRNKIKAKTKHKDIENFVKRSIDKLKEELASKGNRDFAESGPKTVDADADTNFALSLIPMLKMIPIDKKIDAEIEILSILKKYSSLSHDYGTIKIERDDEQSEVDDASEVSFSYFSEDK